MNTSVVRGNQSQPVDDSAPRSVGLRPAGQIPASILFIIPSKHHTSTPRQGHLIGNVHVQPAVMYCTVLLGNNFFSVVYNLIQKAQWAGCTTASIAAAAAGSTWFDALVTRRDFLHS